MENNESYIFAEAPSDEKFLQARDCAVLTGIPEGTWRYWAWLASNGKHQPGPASFKLGPRRRVWRKSAVMAWVEAHEKAGR